MGESSQRQGSISSYLLLLLLFCSLAGNLTQEAMRIHERRNTPRTITASTLQVGLSLPVIPLERITGGHWNLDFKDGNKPAVVYFFSPSCSWCEKNLQGIRSLEQQAGDRYVFYGISLDSTGLSAYMQSNPLGFKAFALSQNTPSFIIPYGTPTTIVVSTKGIIEKSWAGAYTGKTLDDVQNYFKLKLPDAAPSEGNRG